MANFGPRLPEHDKVIAVLNKILEHELSGVVRYTHYSFMVFGHSRIPVCGWLREAANETLLHAIEAGEMVTFFGEHPSLGIGALLETDHHEVNEILKEALEFEIDGIEHYRDLLKLVEGTSVFVEEYARQKITVESLHVGEIDKMLRKPGTIDSTLNDVPNP